MARQGAPSDRGGGRARRLARRLFAAMLVVLLLVGADLAVRLATRVAWRDRLTSSPEVAAQLERTQRTFEAFGTYRAGGGLPAPADEMATVLSTTPEGRPRVTPFSTLRAEDFPRPPATDAAPPGVVRVVMVGGSTTAVSGYPEGVERGLEARLGPGRVEVSNLGISGSYTETTLYTMRRFLPRWRPDLVVVYQGFNDLTNYARLVPFEYRSGERGLVAWLGERLGGDPYPVEEVARVAAERATAAYREMAQLVASLGGQLVLSTFAAPGYDALPADERAFFDLRLAAFWPQVRDAATYQRLLQAYNEAVRRLAAAAGLALIDVAAGLTGGRDVFIDNCHRTEAGVRRHVQLATDVLAPLVEAAARAAGGPAR